MTEFENLKNECAEALKKAQDLHKSLCADIIFKDLHLLEERMPGRFIKNPQGDYILDGEIIIGVSEDRYSTILELEDRRGTAFLWVFTVETPQYYVSDSFSIDKKTFYAVNLLREGQILNGEEEIRKVISKLNSTIKALKSKPDINEISYSYVCVEPDAECQDIYGTINMVLDREPIVF